MAEPFQSGRHVCLRSPGEDSRQGWEMLWGLYHDDGIPPVLVREIPSGQTVTPCSWCRGDLPTTARSDAVYCGRKCRQAAWRLRNESLLEERRLASHRIHARQLRFAYTDPPYPGTASKFYRHEKNYRGEVDHESLIRRLSTYDGWALSTSARALRDLLPLCPAGVRLCAWIKLGGVPPATYGLHNNWEAVIVLQGRRLRPGRSDVLKMHPARFGGTLPGRKPQAFCAWLFDAMGMLPGDTLDDLYPGTGIVGKSWLALNRRADPGDVSPTARGRHLSAGAGKRPVGHGHRGDVSSAAADRRKASPDRARRRVAGRSRNDRKGAR